MTKSVSITTLRKDEGLAQRVNSRHGWCHIENLSGDMEEGIYMATFADDFKNVFECDSKTLTLMFTKNQEENWNDLTEEDCEAILEEIAYFYLRSEVEKL